MTNTNGDSNLNKMQKRDWAIVIAAILVFWALDQITKAWAWNNLGALTWHGPLGLVRHRNPGAMLGIFSDLPPLLRIVSLSTGGAFLVFIYAAIQYLLPQRNMNLRVGMSLLLSGILGNVTDRIFSGSVVDFIVLGAAKYMTPAFNVADVIQWVGYLLIVMHLFTAGKDLWPDHNVRKRLWVNPDFQIKYISILLAVGFGFSLIVGVFSFTYLKIVIDELVVGDASLTEKKFIFPFAVTFLSIVTSFILILFMLGRVLSHRTAGPIYSFEKFLEDLMTGKNREFKLRSGDEFPHLVELANKLRESFVKLPGGLGPTPAAKTKSTDESN